LRHFKAVAFSPNGRFGAITILKGSYGAPQFAWFDNKVGRVMLLSIWEGEVRVVAYWAACLAADRFTVLSLIHRRSAGR
jgi:hypothetical protein